MSCGGRLEPRVSATLSYPGTEKKRGKDKKGSSTGSSGLLSSSPAGTSPLEAEKANVRTDLDFVIEEEETPPLDTMESSNRSAYIKTSSDLSGEDHEVADDIPVHVSELPRTEESEELRPYIADATYSVSLQELSDAVSSRIADPVISPLFTMVSRMFTESRGGFLTLEAPPGTGKSHFAAAVEEFALKTPLTDVVIAVSTVNPFDFDYTMFIHLVRSVLNVKTDDPVQVRSKIDKYLGGFLPEGKRESLTALLCLNFAPLQVKLPKNDIDYLLSSVFYWAARNKPILWVVDNAGQINVRSLRFLKNLRKAFRFIPFVVIFLCSSDSPVIGLVEQQRRFRFSGIPSHERMAAVRELLKTSRLPADIEKVLNKPDRNMLYSQELLWFLMDLGFIFEMRGEWRFQKLPDDLEIPEDIEALVLLRYTMLEPPIALMLRRVVMLNLYHIPLSLIALLFPDAGSTFDILVAKHYLTRTDDGYQFTSRAIVNILRRNFKIEADDRKFYRDIALKLSSVSTIANINRNWLLLSYLNLSGTVDKAFNSFLLSSAVYMEKLGFFELAQRCYQSILSSFGKNQEYRDFRLYLELKNAKLWGFSDQQWARFFWQTMHDTAKNEGLVHVQLVARGELLLLEPQKIVIQEIVDVVKDLHKAGCYEDEISIIDRVVDMLLRTRDFADAKIFALRASQITEDIVSKTKSGQDASVCSPVIVVFVRSSCKLAEVHIALREYAEATTILRPALELATIHRLSYFRSKILFLLGKISHALGEEWESLMQEGFREATLNMDFPVMKSYFRFFEEEQLETIEWVKSYLEYKNWINF